ncbi:fatty-acyl-CoA synthase [Allopseudospirillum japonicum]|uniref:Fatty-acyl-CoA synthase n=1 Tax=Allopseudospirillum japonicum TaxID=64971 RepID=A0A1H6SGX5_9GAMM|nr:fatty acid--CoA ligase [Allopseudospirillum japonicum]SEI67101.1 fatty-acyl-CoA synthase [Allopseudospirillum japonicum]
MPTSLSSTQVADATPQPKILQATDSAYAYPLLIKRILQSGVQAGGPHRIIYRDQQSYDYPTLYQRVCRFANALTDLGVRAGDTVAVLDWDSHRYLESFFAIPMLGAILHTVNVRLAPEQILYTLQHAQDTWILTHDDFAPVLAPMQAELPAIRGYLRLTDTPEIATEILPYVGEYEALLAASAASYEFADFDENAIATLFYTTGTTGDPKGVCFSHRQLVLHTLNEVNVLQAPSTDLLHGDRVYMPITPMFHVHAWGVPYSATLMGCEQVYPGRYEPQVLLELIQKHKVDFSHCVPTILSMILSQAQEMDFNGWRVLIGGSALPKGLARKAKSMNIDVRAAYGMSETCPLLTAAFLPAQVRAADFEEQLEWRTKTGSPVPLVDLRLMDVDGHFVPHDGQSVGEIVVRAPWLTQAYFKDPQSSTHLWAHGWLHTGDVASIDEYGRVQIHDRIKDVIKTGGEWISSLALENLISQHPQVLEVAVVGVPDPQWGERPVALIVPHQPDQAPSAAEIRQHLKQAVSEGHLPKWAIPSQIHCVEQIAKTSVGKLDKKRIRRQLDTQAIGAASFISTHE